MSAVNLLNKLRRVKQVLLSNDEPVQTGHLFDCTVCGAVQVPMLHFPLYYFINWQKYQTIHNPFFIETMFIEHYMCSRCFAFDRERLYALYLNNYYTGKASISLLDIAPSQALQRFLKSLQGINYRSMDLMMEDVDDRLDITDMHLYKDEQFDFFICSHVLEHIPDDKKAMAELYRITKKGGKGIVMVPINLQLEATLEDVNCTDVAKRWKYFFQDDHVRMYSKNDFIQRLESTGFTVEQLDEKYFGEVVFKQHAIYPTSVLYVVSK